MVGCTYSNDSHSLDAVGEASKLVFGIFPSHIVKKNQSEGESNELYFLMMKVKYD